MSKSAATRSDLIGFYFNDDPMPSYGVALQINFHTADPGPDGVATDFAPTPTAYVPQQVQRDSAGWTKCDPDGTPNPSGTAAKTASDVTYPQIESGFVGTETWTYGSVSVVATGQILYYAALDAPIEVRALSNPYFPAGTVLMTEE